MRSIGYSLAISVLLSVMGLVASTGCLDRESDDELDIVVVSIAPQKEMVSRILGPEIEIVVMVPENMEPHTYSPTPGQLLKVADADLYFAVGSGIEFEETNLNTLEETGSHMKVVDISQGIDVISFDDHLGHEGHEEEEDHEDDGHGHGGTDPHIWLDPANMETMADNVLKALEEEDPDNAEKYRSNHEKYLEDLKATQTKIEEMLEPYSDRRFLTYHPAWGYFGDAFDLIQISVEEGGKEPGPQGIAALIEQANDENISVVFVEPQFDSSSAEQIAEAIGGEVVSVDPLAADYMENLERVAQNMVEGFGGSIE